MFNRRIISVASASAVLTAVGFLGTGTAFASTGQGQPALNQGGPIQNLSQNLPQNLSQDLAQPSQDLAHPDLMYTDTVVGPMQPAQGKQSQNPAQQDPTQQQAQSSRQEAAQDLQNDQASQTAMTELLTCSVQISLAPTCTN